MYLLTSWEPQRSTRVEYRTPQGSAFIDGWLYADRSHRRPGNFLHGGPGCHGTGSRPDPADGDGGSAVRTRSGRAGADGQPGVGGLRDAERRYDYVLDVDSRADICLVGDGERLVGDHPPCGRHGGPLEWLGPYFKGSAFVDRDW